MQKCPHHHFKDTSMDHYIVKTFAEKLGNLSISDYHGLRSPGLTCFLNSVLQVLFMTDNFREAVKSNCSTSLDQHLAELFHNLERNVAETHSITKHLGIKDVYEQRDAAEYFEKILCQTSKIASQVFKGELNHETRCHNCKQTNNSKNLFWLLPLSMHDSSRKSFNLQQGLEDFFKVQKVSGENQMFCNRCDKKQDADTKYEMKQSPDVLTLLLKRFTLDYRQSRYKKLQSSADVVPTLNIEGCSYDLYAVVHHYGDLSGGHYTADIKSFETGTWYCFDDRVVTRVAHYFEKNSIRSSTAYLLMYRKVSGQPAKLDVDAQSGRSGVEAEDRRDETETGNALVSEHLKSESCRREDYTHMNGYTLSDELRRKQASSLEKQSRKAESRAEREFMLNPRFPQVDRWLMDCNLNTERTFGSLSDTNSSALMLGSRQNSPVKGQKVNEMTEMQYNRKKTRTNINLSDRSPSRDRNNQSKGVSHQREATAVQEPNMKMTKDSRNGFSKSPRKDKTGRPRETKNVQKSVKEKNEQPWK
uniref:USP domain-containing protein n=2 Tax=Iconisemion striatum TaxID=60296 RepID=A0A1A7XK48_9TELE